MALATFNPLYSSNPSPNSPLNVKNPPIYTLLSTSQFSLSRTLTIPSLKSVSNLGLTSFSSWNGLRKNGFSISLQSLKLEKRKKWKGKGKGVFASLFGVGAPEALVIGVVALLVFGPKGLADVAKNLGKTLRAFQPTIRELQEVSRDFKSTLEKEIGLDELKNPLEENYSSNTMRAPQPSRQVPPELTATPPETTSTEDSQETVTTPGDSSEDPQETSTTPAVSLPDDSQEMDDSISADNTTNERVYSSEDLLKITEEQLKALASQQQKEQTTSEKPEDEI